MTTVRGKQPLELSGRAPQVTAETYGQKVLIKASGWAGTHMFEAQARMEVHCVRNFIRDLRRALRQIRDETTQRLAKAVDDAEGPL